MNFNVLRLILIEKSTVPKIVSDSMQIKFAFCNAKNYE